MPQPEKSNLFKIAMLAMNNLNTPNAVDLRLYAQPPKDKGWDKGS